MASRSTGRANPPSSKGFDFATDDILCSYEDYGNNQDGSNGITHSEPGIGTSSAKQEFHKSRMARPSTFPAASYSPPEESTFHQDVISTVEETMKKYADNLMRFLEGISSRLSQLELYCYNLDKTIGEMRSELGRDNEEAESRLKSVEKHLQEVHRSVQILRDKQELADTQKELAKLQLAQKETSSGNNSQQNQDRSAAASDAQKSDNIPDPRGQQLALALPHQVLPQPTIPSRPVEQQQPQQPHVAPAPQMPSQTMTQQHAYYLPHSQISTVPSPAQPTPGQYLASDSQYRTPQMQGVPAQPQVNQSPQVQQLPPQYQTQWQQQLPQQVQQQPPPQPQAQAQPQPPMQSQMRPSSPPVYASYMSTQPNPSPPEVAPSSMPMQVQFSGMSQPSSGRPEATGYGYSGAGRPAQSQPPAQHLKATYTTPGEGYVSGGPHHTISPGNAYVMYDEGGRAHHPAQPPHFSRGVYPPSSMPPQNIQPPTGSNMVVCPPQFVRNSPYNELIEKLGSMGYRGDHVISVIQRLEESGQPVDFNTVLDRLNGHSSGGPQRGWSG